jgi:hypothetical protein
MRIQRKKKRCANHLRRRLGKKELRVLAQKNSEEDPGFPTIDSEELIDAIDCLEEFPARVICIIPDSHVVGRFRRSRTLFG